MSNVFLSIAIRSCCDARATTKLGARQFSSFLQSFNATKPLSSKSPRWISSHGQKRALSITSRLDARSRARQAPAEQQQAILSPPGSLPTSNLEPATLIASHTEGIEESESWRDYDPAGGLPLPGGELSEAEIHRIFDDGMDVDNGNYILCVLNWRRASGALIDVGIDFPNHTEVTRVQAIQGLEYLRTRYPDVDEQALGTKWAEEESQKMIQELQDRAVKLRLYKPTTRPAEEVEEQIEEVVEQENQQGTEYGRERSGTSAAQGLFASVRAKNIAAREQKVIAQFLKERSLLHAARGPLELAGGVQKSVGVKRYGVFDVVLREPDAVATLETVERKPWVKQYEERATITQQTTAPQIRTSLRLLPSFLVMSLTVGLCFYISNHYTPPSPEARIFSDVPPSVATIGAVTAVMVGLFALSRLPPFWRVSNKYFCVVPAYPFALSNIGAIFRHETLGHLASNVITLWLVGLSLHEDVGRGTFLAIFLGTGVVGSYSALVYNVLKKDWRTYIFGSSGAVLGVLGALCMTRPNGVVSIFGYDMPMAAWLLLTIVGAIEVVSIFRKRSTTLDHAGHLGGLLSGVAAAMYLRSKWSSEKQAMRPLVTT